MKLPKVVSDLLSAQAKFDSAAFAACFSDNAVVFDEAKVHKGKEEIEQWNTTANQVYKTVLAPVEFVESKETSMLTTSVSGTFPGSPIVVNYHFIIKNNLIHSLKITG